jgi:quercetin dioxygenase-like cupin family protein
LPTEQATRLNPAAETIQVGPIRIDFLVDGPDSNGSISLFEVTIPAGSGLPGPPHSHDGFEETIYGLEGVVTYTVDGAAIDVGPGQALCIPRGAVHAFANRGAEDVRLLAVATPGVFGAAYFREVAAVLADAEGGPPDRARMAEVMRRHGLTPAAPAQ